jgi:flagellar hook-length control protein FliK
LLTALQAKTATAPNAGDAQALAAEAAAEAGADDKAANESNGGKEPNADARAKALANASETSLAQLRPAASQSKTGHDSADDGTGNGAHNQDHSANGAAPKAAEQGEYRRDVSAIGKANADGAHTTSATAAQSDTGALSSASQSTATTPSHAQPHALGMAQALTHVPAQAQTHIEANMQAAATVPIAGVAIEIASQALAGKHRFEIRLDPPELGRIDVKLDIDRDGNTTTRLVVERSETLDLLKRDANQLERALQQAGLKTSDSGLEFSLRQQGAEHGDDQPRSHLTEFHAAEDNSAPLEGLRQGYRRLLGLGGGLDIRI